MRASVRFAMAMAVSAIACSRGGSPEAGAPAGPMAHESEVAALVHREGQLAPQDQSKPLAGEPTKNEARPVGCWERVYGRAPTEAAQVPSVKQGVPGCDDCDVLRAGPMAATLHPAVLTRLRAIERALPTPVVEEPVLWVNSGARSGSASKSMHNQALAIDLVICGEDTVGVARRLREAGFTCVIEYWAADGTACNMAHGDLRGTEHAAGAYAPGGWKANSCPKRAVAKDGDCQKSSREDWQYASGGPG